MFSDFDPYQTFIELNHANYDLQLEERELFENDYYGLFAAGKDFLKKKSLGTDSTGGTVGDIDRQSHQSSVVGGNNRVATWPRLLSIPIPKFNGEFAK